MGYSVEQKRTRNEMEMPTFIYGVLSSKNKEKLNIKKNVRIIKEYLEKREKLEIAKEDKMAHLKQLRKNRSISASMYRRLKQVMIYTHEQKRIELIKESMEKSAKIGKPIVNCDNQPKKDEHSFEPNIEIN
jgi:hypothetical protein